MSKIGVKLSINVSAIDKARLFKGKKGMYLDCTAFIDLDVQDEYGNNGMITQDVSKEDREKGEKGPILGNCKKFWDDGGGTQQAVRQSGKTDEQAAPASFDDFSDEIPF